MIACRRLIVDSRVKLDKTHYPWSIELQTKNVEARCSQLPDEEVLSIEADAIEDIENQCLRVWVLGAIKEGVVCNEAIHIKRSW